jgi:phosphoglycolate phosphatase
MPASTLNALSSGIHRAVLFDLDGTLVDTAPDMVKALQDMQQHHGIEPVDYDEGRSNVSNGAMGLLRIGFPNLNEEQRQSLICEFVDRYAARLADESRLFTGLAALLDRLDAGDRPWGVVTNKPSHLSEPLMELLDLAQRSVCIVSGDTLEHRKPHPAPLLHACEVVGVAPAESIYVGDASRDIEAGRAAGMATIGAAYGYITFDDDPGAWGADRIVADTRELSQTVLKAVNLEP